MGKQYQKQRVKGPGTLDVRLSWNDIRARAARFAEEWVDARYERGETQSFYNDFFDVFGVKRRKVATFEEPVRLLREKRGFIDLFWKGVLLVEQKSAGLDLARAKTQALNYFPGLKPGEEPRYVLLSDFQTFQLFDLDEDKSWSFKLADLPANVEHFGFIVGVQTRVFRDQDPVNIAASEMMGRLHDALKASGYEGHDLERLLVRLVFCLFAEDTGIFERDQFLDLLKERSGDDGSDTGRLLNELFEVLDRPEDKRQRQLDENLARFPYVNGDLFKGRLPTAAFDRDMRELLLDASREFKWDAISPAIFGSLFQSVMKKKERRASGAHYTTEKNILKVIEPLFLDDLRARLARLKARRDQGRLRALKAFQDDLAALKFLDPACGCGNFLIITYRELRQLELEALKEIRAKSEGSIDAFDAAALSKLDVNQFYGIEIGEFAARIAEVALWMMDHIMNVRLSLAFGENFARIPLKESPHIHHADALEIEWTTVLLPKDCSFVMGNPPFIGAKYQTAEQRAQIRAIARLGGSGGTLDYVAAWFLKAGDYLRGSNASIGFVATNSITQGEQVAQLWPLLFDRCGLEIAFAHRTFAWGSDTRGMAHVHVVVIGLAKRGLEPAQKRLFSYEKIKLEAAETYHSALSPYLFDAGGVANKHLTIREVSYSLSGAPRLVIGSKPIDGGYLILSDDERADLLKAESFAKRFIRPFIGAVDYINGGGRWILALQDATPSQSRSMPVILDILKKVRQFRRGEIPAKGKTKEDMKVPGVSAKSLAATPAAFHVTVIPSQPFLCVPEVSSERREYVPIGWLSPPVIPSNKLRLLRHAALWQFAVLTSRMHMAWTRNVGGKLKSDFQYSVGINYNTFPWPEIDAAAKQKLDTLAQAVLDARAKFSEATLADLYNPDTMPPALRKAHAALDVAVDRLYRAKPFDSDRERVEHLFGLYEKLVAPLTAAAAKRPSRQKAVRVAAHRHQ